MFNRYVDGLATWAPEDSAMYRENARRLAQQGYVRSTESHQQLALSVYDY